MLLLGFVVLFPPNAASLLPVSRPFSLLPSGGPHIASFQAAFTYIHIASPLSFTVLLITPPFLFLSGRKKIFFTRYLTTSSKEFNASLLQVQFQARPSVRVRYPVVQCRTCTPADPPLGPYQGWDTDRPSLTAPATIGGESRFVLQDVGVMLRLSFKPSVLLLLLLSPCRLDHVMGPEGSMVPPGGQNSLGPSANEASMYPPNRYPHQR